MYITIPKILQDRFATKRVQYESEQSRLKAEEDARLAAEVKILDRQRQLIVDTVEETKVSAKDADWLAERYESDLDYQRDAESYLALKQASEKLQEAERNDELVQFCKNRLVEIDEQIGESKFDLSTRTSQRNRTMKGRLLLAFESAKAELGKLSAEPSLDLSMVKASLETLSEFDQFTREKNFLLSKVASHELKRNNLIDRHKTLIGGGIDNQPIPFTATDSLLDSPFNFPLVGGAGERQPLPAFNPAPCPLKKRRLELQAVHDAEKAQLVAEHELRDVDVTIDQFEAKLHGGYSTRDQKLAIAERLQSLREKKAKLTTA